MLNLNMNRRSQKAIAYCTLDFPEGSKRYGATTGFCSVSPETSPSRASWISNENPTQDNTASINPAAGTMYPSILNRHRFVALTRSIKPRSGTSLLPRERNFTEIPKVASPVLHRDPTFQFSHISPAPTF